MISRPKARNQFLFLVHKLKQDCSSCAKNLALTLWWQLTNKISGTQYHHKLILYSSCHVPRRVLGGATKVEPGTIRVGGERLLAITGALIATNATQRASRCHYQWYLFLFHWMIQSLIHLSFPRLVNRHPGLHLTVLVIKCLDRNHINSKNYELSSPLIPTLLPWNDPLINPTQLSSVCQQSSSSSPNTTHELQAYSIPVQTSPDP